MTGGVKVDPEPGKRGHPTTDEEGRQRRLFVAIPIPRAVETAIANIVEDVRSAARPADGRDVRWVRLDGLHLTLRFLGPTAPEGVQDVAEAMRSAASTTGPFDVVLGGAGTFPGGRRPRALWIGVLDGAQALEAAARTLDNELRVRAWQLDDRPFKAHLTLARADGVRSGAAVAARLVEAARDLELRFSADTMVLFDSHTGGGPARYEPVAMAALGAGPTVDQA